MSGKLLRGARFAKFYNNVLAKLPTSDISLIRAVCWTTLPKSKKVDKRNVFNCSDSRKAQG